MWAIVNKDNNSVTEVLQTAKAVNIDNIQHSKDIFKVWDWTALNNIGIYEYVDSGKPDQRFATSEISYTFDASAKKVTSSYKSTDRNLVTLKTRATLDAKETAYSLIKRLDWLVERLAYDSSKAIPDAVKTYVAAIRTDCATIETAITNASDITAFKKLYSDGTIDKWTGDTNVSAYLR